MPQLEQINTFTAQIFWLFACLGVIYFFFAFVIVPKLSAVVDGRENRISSDINAAETARDTALRLSAEFEKLLSVSRSESMEMISSATKEANSLYDKVITETEKELNIQTNAAEQEINSLKNKVFSELKANLPTYVEEIVTKITGSKPDKNLAEKLVSKINS